MLLFGHIHVICHVFSNEGISKRGLPKETPPPPIFNSQSSNEIFPLFRIVIHPNGFLQALLQKVQSPLQEAFQPNSLSEQ